jgi:polysaccharide biosynthesis/export protein
MRVAIILALFGIVGVPLVASQQAPTAPSVASHNRIVIGADDGVTLAVADADELNKTWRVTSGGDLNLPMLGQVHAAGLTVEQLENELTERLKSYMRDPHVTAYISEFRSQPVTVQGPVGKPGTIQMEGSQTLLEVLTAAGGANVGGATAAGPTLTVTRDMKNGSIPLPGAKTDAKGEYSTVELKIKEVTSAGTPAATLLLRAHDVVTISSKPRLVYVIGQVNRPGAVELDTQDAVSVMQVLAAAGGLTSLAAPGHAEIMHVDDAGKYSLVASVNLKQVITGKREDRMLSPGDIMVVPESKLKSYTQNAAMSATSYGLYALIIGHF